MAGSGQIEGQVAAGSSGKAWGQLAKGFQNPQKRKPSTVSYERKRSKKKVDFYGRSLKEKGPFVESHLLEKIDQHERLGARKRRQDLVATLDGDAGFCRHTFLVHNERYLIRFHSPRTWPVMKLGSFRLPESLRSTVRNGEGNQIVENFFGSVGLRNAGSRAGGQREIVLCQNLN